MAQPPQQQPPVEPAVAIDPPETKIFDDAFRITKKDDHSVTLEVFITNPFCADVWKDKGPMLLSNARRIGLDQGGNERMIPHEYCAQFSLPLSSQQQEQRTSYNSICCLIELRLDSSSCQDCGRWVVQGTPRFSRASVSIIRFSYDDCEPHYQHFKTAFDIAVSFLLFRANCTQPPQNIHEVWSRILQVQRSDMREMGGFTSVTTGSRFSRGAVVVQTFKDMFDFFAQHFVRQRDAYSAHLVAFRVVPPPELPQDDIDLRAEELDLWVLGLLSYSSYLWCRGGRCEVRTAAHTVEGARVKFSPPLRDYCCLHNLQILHAMLDETSLEEELQGLQIERSADTSPASKFQLSLAELRSLAISYNARKSKDSASSTSMLKAFLSRSQHARIVDFSGLRSADYAFVALTARDGVRAFPISHNALDVPVALHDEQIAIGRCPFDLKKFEDELVSVSKTPRIRVRRIPVGVRGQTLLNIIVSASGCITREELTKASTTQSCRFETPFCVRPWCKFSHVQQRCEGKCSVIQECCKFGRDCRKHKAGRCNFFHPDDEKLI